MRVISFDVGIRNCSYCLFSVDANKQYVIDQWGIIDLTSDKEATTHYCQFIDSKIGACSNIAKMTKGDKHYCAKHSKKTEFYKLPAELRAIGKKKMTDIIQLMDKYKISYTKPIKKGQ